MTKKLLLAFVAVFVTWQILDFVIHNMLLMKAYEASASMWRPMEEMKMGLMIFVSAVSAFIFVWVYAKFVSPKSMMIGLQYGIILGVSFGIGMGYGTYAVQPLPYNIALSWFLGTIVELGVAGLLTGLIVKE
ncbi:hypothetical protein JNL27_05765 [bacterium]|nr:hypothetical protein [bacterium]